MFIWASQPNITFRMKTRTRKWYKRVLYHFTDLCVVNAHILNNATTPSPPGPLYQFKLDVALSLMYGENFGPAGQPTDPPGEEVNSLRQAAIRLAENGDPLAEDVADAVRLDGRNHLPENVAHRQCVSDPDSGSWVGSYKRVNMLKQHQIIFFLGIMSFN